MVLAATRRALTRSLCFGHRGVCAIPHPEKAYRGGEDAFFSHSRGIGVADGVGGYAKSGVDPAIYTRDVMAYTLSIVDRATGVTALKALTYGAIAARDAGAQGGCPATVATILEGKTASILNLGDCGILVVRGKKLFYHTEVQQHYFNCPYQLPSDAPSSGVEDAFELHDGDIFMCASDGVFDNISQNELVQHLHDVDEKGCSGVADAIGQHAAFNGTREDFVSPFALSAKKAGYRTIGGKLDDVTVLVSKVAPSDLGECPALISDLLPEARAGARHMGRQQR